jgi:AcrR family transcriptional regulator
MSEIDKKIEILQSARKIFAHYGYDKATLDDIGRLAGLNKTSLYYYYKNKESIFIDVIKSEISESLTWIMIKINDIEGCKNKVIAYLNELFTNSESTINIDKLAVSILQYMKPVFLELSNELIERQSGYLTNILEEAEKNGELVKCDIKRVAQSIVSVVQAIKSKNCALSDYNMNKEVDYSKTEDEVIFTVSLILDGIIKK